MGKVESFQLDHRKVAGIVPYLRECEMDGSIYPFIHKYDFRLCKPNHEFWELIVLHTFEHIFATLMRENCPHPIIDISPMGCGTGFYITIQTSHGRDNKEGSREDLYSMVEVISYVITSMKTLVDACVKSPKYFDEIYHFNEVTCGNYKLHDYLNLKDHLDGLSMEDFLSNTRELSENSRYYFL